MSVQPQTRTEPFGAGAVGASRCLAPDRVVDANRTALFSGRGERRRRVQCAGHACSVGIGQAAQVERGAVVRASSTLGARHVIRFSRIGAQGDDHRPEANAPPSNTPALLTGPRTERAGLVAKLVGEVHSALPPSRLTDGRRCGSRDTISHNCPRLASVRPGTCCTTWASEFVPPGSSYPLRAYCIAGSPTYERVRGAVTRRQRVLNLAEVRNRESMVRISRPRRVSRPPHTREVAHARGRAETWNSIRALPDFRCGGDTHCADEQGTIGGAWRPIQGPLGLDRILLRSTVKRWGMGRR